MTTILIVYLVLLLVGGLMGFLKAGSRVSLITSVVFAAALAFCLWGGIANGLLIAMILQAVLALVFAIRLKKTRKFMPSGLMLIVTAVALAAEFIISRT